MTNRGHYFCEGRCNDVVPNQAYADEALIRCPGCHQLTAHWVPDHAPVRERVQGSLLDPAAAVPLARATVRAETAAKWFAEMHRVVEQSEYVSAI